MSPLKLSLCKLLQLSSAVYLTKRSTPEHYFQFLRLVEQYPGSQLHANRLSTKVVTVSKAYLSNPTKGKEKIFSEMDCDQSKSGDGTLSKRAQKRVNTYYFTVKWELDAHFPLLLSEVTLYGEIHTRVTSIFMCRLSFHVCNFLFYCSLPPFSSFW